MSRRPGHLPGITIIVYCSVWLAAGRNVKAGVELFDRSTEIAALDSCCDGVQRIVVYLFSATKSV